MARFNRKVSLDISEEMLERIDEFKEFTESYAEFHRLALINEIIRRSGQTNFHRPHSLPPLIPKDVPTKRVETAQSEKIPRDYKELWTWFKEGVISKEEYNTLLQRYFPSS